MNDYMIRYDLCILYTCVISCWCCCWCCCCDCYVMRQYSGRSYISQCIINKYCSVLSLPMLLQLAAVPQVLSMMYGIAEHVLMCSCLLTLQTTVTCCILYNRRSSVMMHLEHAMLDSMRAHLVHHCVLILKRCHYAPTNCIVNTYAHVICAEVI